MEGVDKENFTANLGDENIYEVLFESAGEGLVVTDDKGVIRAVNPRTEEMFKYPKGELLGQKIEILVPENVRSHHKSYRDHYQQEPKKRSMGLGMDLEGRRKDGTTFPVEISLNHFKPADKLFVMALITDITERKKFQDELKYLNQKLEDRVRERTRELDEAVTRLKHANEVLEKEINNRRKFQEELIHSQQLYNTIAKNFPNGTINVFDEDLRYIFVDGKELRKSGVNTDVLIGKKFTNHLSEEIRNNVEMHLKNVFEGINATLEIKQKDNYYVLNAVPLPERSGKIAKILVVEQNITKQKKAQHEIQNALEKEKELNELKSRFVSMASHEFRTPLGTILSSLTLLEKYKEPSQEEKRNKHINRIRSSVNNLTSILNDFLSLDKLEEGKVHSNPSLFSFDEFARDLVEEMQAMAKAGQKINYRYRGEGLQVFCDKQMLRNVFINLLSNAIKYSPEEEDIEFVVDFGEDQVEAQIIDHGIGIPLEEQKNLFQRFFRAKNATNIQGTGLGLNIVNKYLELVGGEITFTSEPGKGTTFKVTIPREQKIS